MNHSKMAGYTTIALGIISIWVFNDLIFSIILVLVGAALAVAGHFD
jgi:hypothetical protein